jgi:hypothetical protein
MKRYTFEVYLGGTGDTPEDAWENMLEGFFKDPGPCPDEFETEEELPRFQAT